MSNDLVHQSFTKRSVLENPSVLSLFASLFLDVWKSLTQYINSSGVKRYDNVVPHHMHQRSTCIEAMNNHEREL